MSDEEDVRILRDCIDDVARQVGRVAEAIERATTRLIYVTVGSEQKSTDDRRFRVVDLHSTEAQRQCNKKQVSVSVVALDCNGLKRGAYYVRVNLTSTNPEAWDWHDWRPDR